MITIGIPALQRDGRYDDLEVLLLSCAKYAPKVPVVVAWKGTRPPYVGRKARLVPQPPEATSYGAGCATILDAVGETEDVLLLLNDDTVLTPTTVPWLTEDLAALGRMDGPPVGLVGLRSNYVAWGPQNVRWPGITAMLRGREVRNSLQYTIEQDLVGINFVYGVAFAATPAVLRAGGTDWLQLHWCSDTLLSFDLEQAGYQHYVSRAYVHHHGSRSGGVDVYPRLEQDARRWLEAYRPDFARRTWTG